jgi:hypothetical protein
LIAVDYGFVRIQYGCSSIVGKTKWQSPSMEEGMTNGDVREKWRYGPPRSTLSQRGVTARNYRSVSNSRCSTMTEISLSALT